MRRVLILSLALAAAVLLTDAGIVPRAPVHIRSASVRRPSTVSAATGDTVTISTGQVQGNTYTNARGWLGIPFAEPPVGELRWADPVPAKSWSGVKLTTNYSDGCPQNCNLPIGCPTVQSEDCLYLNVWTPLEIVGGPLPVLVFLPGGRYMQGTAGTPLYDARNMVNLTNTIMVTTNYRLGALGFMGTESLKGNWGFNDQRLALKWVQQNIKAFGGNPDSVTLFGQSAGGTSTAAHLVSPPSQGLFHAAIVESNPWALRLKTPKQASELGAKMAKDMGCKRDDVSCMRNVTWQDVAAAEVKAQGGLNLLNPLLSFYPWTPIVDGVELTDQPMTIYAEGKGPKTPVIFGTVEQEGVMFIYQALHKPLTNFEYGALIDGIFFFDAPRVKRLYPDSTQPSPTPSTPSTNGTYGPQPPSSGNKKDKASTGDNRTTLSTLANDYILMCPARHAMSGAVKSGAPVWYYQFDHVMSFSKAAWGKDDYCDGQICHGSELPFVFGSPSFIHINGQSANFTADEQKLSNDIMMFWGNFAHTHNPNNGPNKPSVTWPGFDPSGSNQNIEFQAPNSFVVSNLKKEYCDMLDTTNYKY